MVSLSCSFCAHRNPEGSKFCNECGSPLNLAPCPHCETINNLSEEVCSACGASLTSPAEADRSVDEASAGVEAGGAQEAFADETHVAHAEESDAREHHTSTVIAAFAPESSSHAAAEPSLAQPSGAEPPGTQPLAAEPAERARWQPHNRQRTYGVFLGVAFVAIAGAVFYWPAIVSLQQRVAQTSFGAASTPARENESMRAAESPAQPPAQQPSPAQPSSTQPSPTPPASTPPATAEPAPPATAETAPPATVQPAPSATVEPAQPAAPESSPAQPDTAQAASQPPEPAQPASASAQAPSSEARDDSAPRAPVAAAARPSSSTTAARSRSRIEREAAARSAAAARTREQAERDALATQRVIARELGRPTNP